jgi:predicted ester cyclase
MSEKEVQNKQTVVRLFEEVVNQGRLEVLDEIAWPDHLEHRPLPGQTQGREGLKQRASMVRAAFNPHFTLEHVLADSDKVAVMWTSRGTHVAEWFGIPATGKSIVTQGVDIFLLRDGRLAEHWDVVDVTDFLVKTGALAAPSGAPGAAR